MGWGTMVWNCEEAPVEHSRVCILLLPKIEQRVYFISKSSKLGVHSKVTWPMFTLEMVSCPAMFFCLLKDQK